MSKRAGRPRKSEATPSASTCCLSTAEDDSPDRTDRMRTASKGQTAVAHTLVAATEAKPTHPRKLAGGHEMCEQV